LSCIALPPVVENGTRDRGGGPAYLSVSTDEELLRSVAGLAVADIPGARRVWRRNGWDLFDEIKKKLSFRIFTLQFPMEWKFYV